jgi:hypothetical protein
MRTKGTIWIKEDQQMRRLFWASGKARQLSCLLKHLGENGWKLAQGMLKESPLPPGGAHNPAAAEENAQQQDERAVFHGVPPPADGLIQVNSF